MEQVPWAFLWDAARWRVSRVHELRVVLGYRSFLISGSFEIVPPVR